MRDVTMAAYEHTDARQQLLRTCRDLEQPVGSVLTLAVAALAVPGLAPATRRRLTEIVRQANWQAAMIEDFVQVERGDTAGDDDSGADVVSIVNDVIEASCVTWPGHVAVTAPTGPVGCRLRPVLLRRVVHNLLSNAMRAAGPSGTVAIEIRRQVGATMLSVRDNGPGFGQVPRRTGIGLAAVARIIARYEGRMEYGRDAASGACVRLWLP